MILSWLLSALTVSCLAAIATAAAARVANLTGRPQRWVWLGGTAGTVLLILWPGLSSGLDPLLPSLTPSSARSYVHQVQGGFLTGPSGFEEIAVKGLLSAWALSSLVLLVIFCWTQLRLRKMIRSGPVQVSGTWVHLTDDIGPAVVGVFDRQIVIPHWLVELPADELELILTHEGEHVRAGDTALLSLGALMTALIPWNPVMWWLNRRLRLAVELDCDARVLRRGAGSREYGKVLLQMACRSRLLRAPAPGFLQHGHALKRRIAAIAGPRTAYAPVKAVLFGAVAACAMLFAFEVPTWATDPVDARPAFSSPSPRQMPGGLMLVPLRAQDVPAESGSDEPSL